MQIFLSTIFAIAASALLSYAFLRIILYVAYKYEVFDPIGERHVHSVDVPRLGGIAFVPAIYGGIALTVLCAPFLGLPSGFPHADGWQAMLFVVAFTLIYIEGIADDLKNLGYKLKFFSQFLSASVIVYSGIRIDNLMGFCGIDALPSWVSAVFSVIIIVFIVNAVNLIDGIDGLSSSLAVLFCCLFGGLFAVGHDSLSLCYAAAAVGVVIPFYYFNVFGLSERRTKIFMGDCGSQCLGLLLAYFALKGWTTNGINYNPLVYAIGILLVPSFDVLRVMIGRMLRGNHPFRADKTHIHHKFLALGFSHRAARSAILTIALTFFFVTVWLSNLIGSTLTFVADIALWCILQSGLNFWLRRNGCTTYFEAARKSNKGND